jgi:hypothetical protein
VRERKARVRQPQVLRALRAGADHARHHLNGDFPVTGPRHLDADELRQSGGGPYDRVT